MNKDTKVWAFEVMLALARNRRNTYKQYLFWKKSAKADDIIRTITFNTWIGARNLYFNMLENICSNCSIPALITIKSCKTARKILSACT